MFALLKAFVLGFSVAAPVGPIGVLCIRRTLAEGRRVGFASGMGAATADAIYATCAALGFGAASNRWTSITGPLRWLGAGYLAWLGIRTWRASVAGGPAAIAGSGVLGAWASTLVLTLTNPLTILSFVAMFSSIFGAESRNTVVLVVGVLAGSSAWWLFLSAGVASFRDRVTPQRLHWVNRSSGVVLVGFAAWAVLR